MNTRRVSDHSRSGRRAERPAASRSVDLVFRNHGGWIAGDQWRRWTAGLPARRERDPQPDPPFRPPLALDRQFGIEGPRPRIQVSQAPAPAPCPGKLATPAVAVG